MEERGFNILWPLHIFIDLRKKKTMAITIQQVVITVPNDDVSINDAIATQVADNYHVTSITLSGIDVILLFTRTIST